MLVQRAWLDEGNMLMLLPEALLGVWHGVLTADYDRAVPAADSWMVSIPVGGGVGLLLGGDPGMALLVHDARETLKVVRWNYARDEEELVEFALRGEDIAATEPDLVFENTYANWVMFDSAADPFLHRPSTRFFELPISRIRVTTTFLETERNSAIVHAFGPDACHLSLEWRLVEELTPGRWRCGPCHRR